MTCRIHLETNKTVFEKMKNMKKSVIMSAAAVAMVVVSCKSNVEFDACGQIDAVQVTVSSESNGRILDFDLNEGDKVCAGQVLGSLDTVQLSLQIAELKERIAGAKARMVDISCQGKPNQRQLASFENDLQRYTKLLESNAATQKQVDDIRDKITVLKAQISAQNQSWERGNSSVRAEVKTYEMQLAQREDQLLKCRITAPVSGTVLTKYAEEGEFVTSGKALFKIADMDHAFVRAYFTTAQLAGLKTGDSLTVIPDDGSNSPQGMEGRLIWISDQAEFTPKNIQTRDERADMVYAVKVAVPAGCGLRLGMYAYIRK